MQINHVILEIHIKSPILDRALSLRVTDAKFRRHFHPQLEFM